MKSGERDPCQLISSIITVVGMEFWRGILLSRNKVGLSPCESLTTMQIIILDRSEWILNRSHAWFHFDCVHPLVCIECTWWQAAMFASPKFKKVENRIKNYLFQLQFWYSLLTIRSIPHHTSKSEIYLLISYFFGDKNQIIKSYIPPKNELNSGLSSIFFIFHSVIKFHYSSRSFLSIFPFLFYY